MFKHKYCSSRNIMFNDDYSPLIKPVNGDFISRTPLRLLMLEQIELHYSKKIYEINTIKKSDLQQIPIEKNLCIKAYGKTLNHKQLLKILGFKIESRKIRHRTKHNLPTQRQLHRNTKILDEFIDTQNGPSDENKKNKINWAIKKLNKLRLEHKQNKKIIHDREYILDLKELYETLHKKQNILNITLLC